MCVNVSTDLSIYTSFTFTVILAGGCGGGILRLDVTGLMKIDGILSVNGQNASRFAGGGSGGSIYFVAGHFDGTGYVQVCLICLTFVI